MKLLIAILPLTVMFSVGEGQKLQCPLCNTTESTCPDTKVVNCSTSDHVCYAAKVLVGNETRYAKGCKESNLCGDLGQLCPPLSEGKCLGAGCCNTSGCIANITELSTVATSTLEASVVSTTQLPVQITVAETSSAIMSSTQPVAVQTTIQDAAMSATPSTVHALMSSHGLRTNETQTPEPTCDGQSMSYRLNSLIIMSVAVGLTAIVF